MTRQGLKIAVVVLGTFVFAPSHAAENWPDSVDQYVAQVRKTIDTTDINGYLAVVDNPNGATLIDVREESEFAAGYVPGTTNVSRGRLEFRIKKALGYPNQVDMNRKIQNICAMRQRRPRHAGGETTSGYWLHQCHGRRDGFGGMAGEGTSFREGGAE